jgi:hypothetical protein
MSDAEWAAEPDGHIPATPCTRMTFGAPTISPIEFPKPAVAEEEPSIPDEPPLTPGIGQRMGADGARAIVHPAARMEPRP